MLLACGNEIKFIYATHTAGLRQQVEARDRWLNAIPTLLPPNTTTKNLNADSKSGLSDLGEVPRQRSWQGRRGLGSKRTLTNLYNARPTWLDLAHKRLDEAVFAAYGWKSDLPSRTVVLAQGAGALLPDTGPLGTSAVRHER